MKPKSKHLTAEQVAYIEAHYPNESNEQIAEALGVSVFCIRTRAAKHHLRKSKEYLSKINKERAVRCESHKRINTPEAHAKGIKTHQKLYDVEKMRIRWGLLQKTKRHFRIEGRDKLLQRNRLQRLGYIIDEAKLIAYYTPETHRAKRLEAIPRGVRKGTIKPYYDFKPYGEMD